MYVILNLSSTSVDLSFPIIVIAVILYHIACFIEYKLGIEDTARVVPVHAMGCVQTSTFLKA